MLVHREKKQAKKKKETVFLLSAGHLEELCMIIYREVGPE